MTTPPTTLIGVDFSGAQQDNATWIAIATIGNDGQLAWQTPFPIRRADLEQLLLTINGPTIAALDFPFGLPSDFAMKQGFIRWGEGLMDSCDRMSTTDQAEFKEVTEQYLAAYRRSDGSTIHCRCRREPSRVCDDYPAYSPLHGVQPSMREMTYHGMAMLGRLLRRARGRFKIPPLPANAVRGQVTLVELMPGQLLRARGDSGIGYKTGLNTLPRRHEILSRLEAWIDAPLPEHIRLACRANADCLDAVVNLIGAREWHRNPDAFNHPTPTQSQFTHIEGWLYTLRRP